MSLPTLDYASAVTDARRWRPVLFRPSVRSILLSLLTAAAIAWVNSHHVPWRHVAKIAPPSDAEYLKAPSLFTPAGEFVVLDETARVYHPDTGRLVRTLGRPQVGVGAHPYTFPLLAGREAVQVRDRALDIYDTATGDLRRSIRLPDHVPDFLAPKTFVASSPTARRVITCRDWDGPDEPVAHNAHALTVWDLDAARADLPIARLGRIPYVADATFSADGRLLAIFPFRRGAQVGVTAPVGAYDAETVAHRFDVHPPTSVIPYARAAAPAGVAFSADSSRLLVPIDGGSTALSVHATDANRQVAVIPFFAGPQQGRAVSPDGRLFALDHSTTTAGHVLNLFDVGAQKSLTQIELPTFPRDNALAFFPDGRRLFGPAPVSPPRPTTQSSVYTVYHTPTLRPLAYIESPTDLSNPIPSPTGRHLAATGKDGQLHLFHRPHWAARESVAGIWGMPHAVLAIVLLAGAALSLRADARRAAPSPSLLATLSLVLLIAALPRAAHFALSAATGPPIWTAAPLLLLCAVGLGTASRFWVLATAVALLATAAVNGYCFWLMKSLPADESTALPLLDRAAAVPNLALSLACATATVAAIVGLVVLIRADRRPVT